MYGLDGNVNWLDTVWIELIVWSPGRLDDGKNDADVLPDEDDRGFDEDDDTSDDVNDGNGNEDDVVSVDNGNDDNKDDDCEEEYGDEVDGCNDVDNVDSDDDSIDVKSGGNDDENLLSVDSDDVAECENGETEDISDTDGGEDDGSEDDDDGNDNSVDDTGDDAVCVILDNGIIVGEEEGSRLGIKIQSVTSSGFFVTSSKINISSCLFSLLFV